MSDASPKKRHKFALAAFILGVVSIVIPSLVPCAIVAGPVCLTRGHICIVILSLVPCAIVALVLGIKTIKQVNRDPANLGGKGLAIAGVATAGTSIFFLAIIAITMLAGILVPTTVKYVQSAKLRRSTEDVKAIGTAIGNFYNDLGKWPVWKDGSAMTGVGTTATAWSILKFGAIDTTTGAVTSNDPTAGAGWTTALLTGTDQTSGAQHLWINDPDGDGTPGGATAYPNNTTDPTLRYAWRGPYIEQFCADPWGNNYLVNTIQLWPTNEQGNGVCYVLCAGPNKVIETTYAQGGPNMVVRGDDIVFRIK